MNKVYLPQMNNFYTSQKYVTATGTSHLNLISVGRRATDYTCSAVCQLRVPSTPAASQNLCENLNICEGPPLHIPTVISLRYHTQP